MHTVKKISRIAVVGICLVLAAQASAVGTLYVSSDGSQQGISVRDSQTLVESNSFAVAGSIDGVTRGAASDLYLAAEDTLYNYNLAGGLLNSISETGVDFTDVTIIASQLVASATGARRGFSIRALGTMAETNFFDTTFDPMSLEDGFGRLYITSGDSLYIYALDGTELEMVTAATGVTFVESALSGTRLYVATGGASDGVSIRNPINLDELGSFTVPFAIEGLVAGDDNDLFLTSGDNVYRYLTDGTQLETISAGSATLNYTDVAFIADPIPPAVGTVLALTTGATQAISTRDAETLADAGSFAISVDGTGLTLGLSNDFYIAAGGTLLNYSTSGALISSVMGGGGLVFSDVAVVGSELIATTTGTQSGFSLRDLASLAENNFRSTTFDPSSVAAGIGSSDIYLTSASTVYRYDTAGTELGRFTANDGRIYTDVALVKNVVYATYTNAEEDGISVLEPTTLIQIDVIITPIAPEGITPGGTNDYYISGADTIFHYALDEILSSFTVGSGNSFPDIIYSAAGVVSQTSVVAATLPGSRSVQLGATASAFATIINAGSVVANDCRISPRTSVPANFSYQTTDPATNQLTGTPNTPIDIAADGGFQTFFFSFVPTDTFDSTDVELDFQCLNAPAAPITIGVNTLLLSSDANPVADVVALAATASNNGIVEIPGVGMTGAFSVASVNVGIGADIQVQANVTDGDPNISISLCETNPTTGACINPTAPGAGPVLLTIAGSATPTFSIFVNASAAVPLDAANKRINVVFTEQGSGTVRGTTSVAVRTQ